MDPENRKPERDDRDQEDLEEQEVKDLPDREAMTLIGSPPIGGVVPINPTLPVEPPTEIT